MFSAQFEVLKAVSKLKTPQKEDCLKKLASFSRFVTPCPDILDGAFSTEKDTDGPPAYSTVVRPEDNCVFENYAESVGSSDELSSWESVKHLATSAEGQWRNLIEYEESLLLKKGNQPTASCHSAGPQQHYQSVPPSSSRLKPPVESDSKISSQDIPKSLDAIAKSLQKLEAQRCESAEDKFAKYISQRLREMSKVNRTSAEIEINKVLMKYLAKQFQEESLDDSFSEDSDRNI